MLEMPFSTLAALPPGTLRMSGSGASEWHQCAIMHFGGEPALFPTPRTKDTNKACFKAFCLQIVAAFDQAKFVGMWGLSHRA